jgi:hypothetical protein
MARETYVYRPGLGVIPKSEAEPLPWVTSIRTDGMDATHCPADGKTYDSRSAYYAAVRSAGCEIVGNERLTAREAPRPPVRDTMKRALDQLRSR